MKRIGPLGVALGLVLAGGVALFFLRSQTNSREISQQVEEILRTPQAYDGEQIDNLARLGPVAVPAIGEVLSAGEAEFPLVLVIALREIGDARGAEPILSFIRSRAPHSDSGESTLTAAAIRALGSIPNPVVCEPLTDIFEDVSSHPSLRLTSAATVFRSCEGEVAAAAEDLILDLYHNRNEYYRDVNEGFHEGNLYGALLAAAESDEIANILIDLMSTFPGHFTVPAIVASIDGGREGFPDALRFVLNAPETPFETQLAAAQRLLDLDERPDQGLRARIEEMVTEAEENGYPPAIVEEAQRLRRMSESQLLD
jgi:hypothetical protein